MDDRHAANDIWSDQGGGNRDWQANTATIRVKGALQKRATYLAHGPFVTVNVVMEASVSLACDKGAAIAGLPFAAADYSANVKITNITAQTDLGGGYVRGAQFISAGNRGGSRHVVITATYMV